MKKIAAIVLMFAGLLMSSTCFAYMEMQQWCEVQISNAGNVMRDVNSGMRYEDLIDHYVRVQRDVVNQNSAKDMVDVAYKNKSTSEEDFQRYWARRCPDDFNRTSTKIRERQHYGY